ncbi:MAG: formylglycine-generating enzyme family protein [Deltaproteobacteria bacterium]|nr:formylglycine-generating enzyme family protein [Deltaproteobacteria bacterium]
MLSRAFLFCLVTAALALGASPLSAQTPVLNPPQIVNAIGIRFNLIPAGTFNMGAGPAFLGEALYELPVHPVTISKPFYLAATVVTQFQWSILMDTKPSIYRGRDNPVDSVSHDDALEFIRRLNEREGRENYRLPTEAEWEYAARAGGAGNFCFGDDVTLLPQYAWYGGDYPYEGPQPVGKKEANAWGLYDAHGNVFEWVADWFAPDYYASSPRVDPQGPASGEDRVNRGGSWASVEWNLQSATRNHDKPSLRSMITGFRLARNAN